MADELAEYLDDRTASKESDEQELGRVFGKVKCVVENIVDENLLEWEVAHIACEIIGRLGEWDYSELLFEMLTAEQLATIAHVISKSTSAFMQTRPTPSACLSVTTETLGRVMRELEQKPESVISAKDDRTHKPACGSASQFTSDASTELTVGAGEKSTQSPSEPAQSSFDRMRHAQ